MSVRVRPAHTAPGQARRDVVLCVVWQWLVQTSLCSPTFTAFLQDTRTCLMWPTKRESVYVKKGQVVARAPHGAPEGPASCRLVRSVAQMSVETLGALLRDAGAAAAAQLLDVREPREERLAALPGFRLLPLSRCAF
jgi:hypothetical protein